jgi:hypothetical protein
MGLRIFNIPTRSSIITTPGILVQISGNMINGLQILLLSSSSMYIFILTGKTQNTIDDSHHQPSINVDSHLPRPSFFLFSISFFPLPLLVSLSFSFFLLIRVIFSYATPFPRRGGGAKESKKYQLARVMGGGPVFWIF